MTDFEKIKTQRQALRFARDKIEGNIEVLDVYIHNFGSRRFDIRHQIRQRRNLVKQLTRINEQLGEIEHQINWDISLYPQQDMALEAALQER